MVDYSLYLCTDRSLTAGRELSAVVEEAILGGVSIVQVREKEAGDLEFYRAALEIKAVTRKYNIPLIINNRLDIALAVQAEGVHIGQGDLPLSAARSIVPDTMLIGVSVGSVEEALQAQADKADYVGAGPVFVTSTKPEADKTLGLEGLRLISRAVRIPTIAIGGVNSSNVDEIFKAGAAGIAVISAIMTAPSPRKAAAGLKRRKIF
ncbi:MAG: thiamine phosphate synthase [Syntrophomonadaceae bacterium]|jgi:thiamine-phosphate pyrophosphorylase|nr:thiamine phosphate synthase [Syntrophomonadaceae bacterium]